MMGKLMIDSVLTWARDYKVDGFRFDLMGHQPKQAMVDLRKKLDRLSLRHDGVAGKDVYLYGEGWNFGEVADDARFEQASQLNMAGTGIGTFNDRLRDAVRGGGPFDDNPRVQGFGSGLFTDPNGDPVNGTLDQQKARLLLAQDQIKVGLTGNLKDYTFVDRTGIPVSGSEVDYNGQPAGYTADPAGGDHLRRGTRQRDAVRRLGVQAAPVDVDGRPSPDADRLAGDDGPRTRGVLLARRRRDPAQQVPGPQQLRQRRLVQRARLRLPHERVRPWAPATTRQRGQVGLHAPPARRPRPRPQHPADHRCQEKAEELLEIRRSSPLFRLGSARLVERKLSFPNGGPAQTPGVIVMKIDDTVGPNSDPARKGLVVVFNASDEATTQQVPGTARAGYTLHPVQATGSDPVVRTASYDSTAGRFTVPARTVAVFQR